MSERLITIKPTHDQIELVKAMASKDQTVAYEAKAAVAELMGPVISAVIDNAPTVSNLYQTMEFGEDDNPSIPLDLFHDITDEDYIRVYSQSVAGGLASSEMFPAHDELKFKTYPLDAAVSVDKKYLRRSRLDVLSAVFSRFAQEFLLKQEKTSMNELAYVLVTADTKVNGTSAAGNHVIDATTDNQFTLADFNNLMTRAKRLWSSYSSGTPSSGLKMGVTDLICSPEIVEEIRSMAYQPVNTRSGSVTTSGATSIAAPEDVRQSLMNAGGLPTFFGIGVIEINEMGVNQRYNKIFSSVNSSAGSPVTFTQANDEIVLAVNRANPGLWRPVVREEGVSSTVSLQVDDQFAVRQNKAGWYGMINEGRIATESRNILGITV